jgi:hypothetical protein
MLYLLFMGAIIVIGIALIPVALLTLWFLAPFLLVLAGAGIVFLAYPPAPHNPAMLIGVGLAVGGAVWLLERYDW